MNEPQEKPFMSTWTVYYDPLDFPGKFVARRDGIFRTEPRVRATTDRFVADSLREIRDMLPPGLAHLTRSEGDEPQIVEIWV